MTFLTEQDQLNLWLKELIQQESGILIGESHEAALRALTNPSEAQIRAIIDGKMSNRRHHWCSFCNKFVATVATVDNGEYVAQICKDCAFHAFTEMP